MPESEFRHQLIGDRGEQRATEPLAVPEQKFTPADATVDWVHINSLVHGPGAAGGREGGDNNSAVFACLMALATAFPEPPLRVWRKRAGNEYPIPEHPLQQLLDKPTPNGELSLEDLLFWTAWAEHTDGNAYWLKVRAGDAVRGNVVQLWPVAPNRIAPVTRRDRDGRVKEWISHYKMQVGPGKYDDVPVENVIHFRLGVDPRDMRLGLSPLKRLVREIATDDEASRFTDTLLSNYAIPGLVVVPSGATVVDKASADRISKTISQRFSGENRGKVAVLSRESVIQQFGFSPEQLQMDALHRLPEERIAAVIGVPAIIAGLGAGLQRSTFANFRESREMFTEQTLAPRWRATAARLNVSLKPDFSGDRLVSMAFDTSEVRAFQEDENARYIRLNTAVQGGWMTRNEARSATGLEPVPGWDEEDTATFTPPPTPEPEPVPADDSDDGEGEKRRPFGSSSYRNGNGMNLLTKASRTQLRRRQRSREHVAGKAAKRISQFFRDLADAVIRAAARQEPAVAQAGNGQALAHKALSRGDWARILDMIFDQQSSVLEGIIKLASLEIIRDTWESLSIELGQIIQFNENDPIVLDILEEAGKRIKGIQETTLDLLRPALIELYREGEPIETIASRVRQLVEETYSGRAVAIARTEVGMAQQQATSGRYKRAGVKYVQVLDNGFSNSHPFCKRVDGKVVTLEWAQRNPLQHPRCVRAFAAVFDYNGPVFEEEERWN